MDGNKKANNLPCEVVQDLLPLYADGVVSEKTAEAVSAHLEGCGDCKKEYELIKTELPLDGEKLSTGKKFAMMMKKLHLRRLIIIAVTVILTCAVLAGGFYGLTQVPVRQLSDGNISIERAYAYEDGTGSRLFVLCMVPAWNSPTFHRVYLTETAEPGVWQLNCEFKVAVVSGRFGEFGNWESVWDIEINADLKDVKAITFEGKTIWDTKNTKPVPDYVMAHRDYMGPMDEFNGMTVDAEKNLIGFDNAEEKHYIYWDLDGNLLYEGDGKDADKVIDFDVPLDLADYPPVDE